VAREVTLAELVSGHARCAGVNAWRSLSNIVDRPRHVKESPGGFREGGRGERVGAPCFGGRAYNTAAQGSLKLGCGSRG